MDEKEKNCIHAVEGTFEGGYVYEHKWRIIENFHEELPRDLSKPRVYAAYCVYCLESKGVEIKINK